MDSHRIDDPAKLRSLIDAILILEEDADLSTLLRVVVEQATSLVGARYGALGVLNEDGEQLDEFITVGLTPEERATIGAFPVGKGLLRRVITDAAPLRVAHLSTHADRAGLPPQHPPMETFLGVPVRLGAGKVYGNLYLCDKGDGTPFSEADEALADTLGRVAGLLIDKAQLRLKLTDLTLATERERMARDLHDSVIQRLFAVGLMLQGASNATLPDPVRATLANAVDELDETIRDIRATIFAITRQSDAEAPSLRRELLELADEVSTRLGLKVSISFDGPIDTAISQHIAAHALAAAREMLSNVVRHAEATNADFDIIATDSGITLRLSDNGRGITPDHQGHGNGLRNLSARAIELGGWCSVRNGESGGAVVEWHVTGQSKEPA